MGFRDGRRCRARRQRSGERGFATAEFAVALPAIVLVLAAVVGTLQALLLHHQALHAASVGARLAARGESPTAVTAAIGRTGPTGANSSTQEQAGLVRVRVEPGVPQAVAWVVPDLSAEVSAVLERSLTDGEDAP